ncbi:hypothetical protein D3C76_1342800 [compost metagenome]
MIQRIVGVYAVSTHTDNRLKQMLLSVLANVELPHAAVLLAFVQLGHQCVHPTGYSLLIAQIGFSQRRLINQLFQQRAREATLHTANHFLRCVVLRDQFFQWLTRHSRSVGIGMQGRTIQSDRNLVLIHRFVVFNVLFLLAFLHFVQRWLCNVDMTAFNDFWHLTVEEGQQQGTDV